MVSKHAQAVLTNADAANTSRDIILRLVRVLSRQAPMDNAKELLDDNLIVYMDDRKISTNCGAWYRWVRFLHRRADKKMSNLIVDVENIECRDDTVLVSARWRADIKGETTFSDSRDITYQIRDEKIIALWTCRKNYTFIYGNVVNTWLGFYWIVLQMLLTTKP